MALVAPAREVPGVEVIAVAARDADKARRFAEKHIIPIVHGSYKALLADPDVNAVYNPLPNGLHGEWTIAALRAGKHVLCEKPFAANAEEAQAVAQVAAETGLVVMEAFHYRYHGLTRRLLEIVGSGALGTIEHIEAAYTIPLFTRDIRWQFDLAGGSLMDIGCYAVHLVRTLAGAEPTVRSARAKLMSPGVDRWLNAQLDFADGRTAEITAAMASARIFGMNAIVTGSEGTMRVFNPVLPHLRNSIALHTRSGKRKERVDRLPTSYVMQLRAFADAVLHGAPVLTGPEDAVANMKVIDACYAAARLPRREPAAAFRVVAG